MTPLAPPPLARGFSSGVSAAEARWRPGLANACRHSEIFASSAEASGAGLALSLALDARRAAASASGDDPDERAWLWVQDKVARRLSGRPYYRGMPEPLRHRLIHVAAGSPEDALFALEEGLRCRELAFVIGEIAGNPRALGLTASRRLSLAAEKHGVPLWLVRLDAKRDLGSARLRWEARSTPSARPRWDANAPGAPAWEAELLRAHTHQPGRWRLEESGVGSARILRQVQDERALFGNGLPNIRSA
ncbi:MAG TPA: hypothetical protein VM055_01140 [Novosphingobium sp.]|nr:hypothetical protein [Novosphingobium sp.]